MRKMKEIKTADDIERIFSMVTSGETIVVSRPGKQNIVILSEDKYNVMAVAQHNAEYQAKIERAIANVRAGKVITKTMEELEAMANE